MKARDRIEKALKDNEMPGHVWKGYSGFTMQSGWHVSNGQDWYLGQNATDAVDTIEALAEARSDP